MNGFIPNRPTVADPTVPFYEDVGEADVKLPGKYTAKTLSALQNEIVVELALLGGGAVQFVEGVFDTQPPRHGYRVEFVFAGNPARIDCAALPVRNPTELKLNRAKAQALYLLRDWLRAERTAWVYRPGSYPLAPYLVDKTGRTVVQALIEAGDLPRLAP